VPREFRDWSRERALCPSCDGIGARLYDLSKTRTQVPGYLGESHLGRRPEEPQGRVGSLTRIGTARDGTTFYHGLATVALVKGTTTSSHSRNLARETRTRAFVVRARIRAEATADRARINIRGGPSSRVTRRGKPALPQPPWVWGPGEVNEWMRSAYPSNRRRAHGVRKGPETITRLRMVVDGLDVVRVRTETEGALSSIGLGIAGTPAKRTRPRVVAKFRRSWVGEHVQVVLRFTPPIHGSSCKRIVRRLGDHLRVLTVSVSKGRGLLPPKSQ